jgi:hypothetical protein
LELHLKGINPGLNAAYNSLMPRAFQVTDPFFGGAPRDAQEQIVTGDYAAYLRTDQFKGISVSLLGGLRSYQKAGVAITGDYTAVYIASKACPMAISAWDTREALARLISRSSRQ